MASTATIVVRAVVYVPYEVRRLKKFEAELPAVREIAKLYMASPRNIKNNLGAVVVVLA